VHVAGGFAMSAVEETSLDAFAAQWNVNVVTAFLACREAVRNMKAGEGGGRIVNVGARAGVDHPPGKIAYVAAKAALLGMTRALAAETRAHGILVNAVVPDTLDTPANRIAMPEADRRAWTRPESIGKVILWLVSPGNETVTGALIPV
jgi:NAD(P)-dependent dehydrogenase (short-subunit alcohol dehydrogenase family)